MPDTLIRLVHRVVASPRTTFRFAVANAMFVLLVARELVTQTLDE